MLHTGRDSNKWGLFIWTLKRWAWIKLVGDLRRAGRRERALLDMKKAGYVRRTDRQTLTAQDSHVQPGVDVGQFILERQGGKVLMRGRARVILNESALQAPTRMPEAWLRIGAQTYIEHGRISAELHQVLTQFALVLVQHVSKNTWFGKCAQEVFLFCYSTLSVQNLTKFQLQVLLQLIQLLR